MKQNITYDKKSKILSIKLRPGSSVDSEIEGNVVVDYDKNGKVVRVDVMDFSLSDFGLKVGQFEKLVGVSR